MSEDKTSVEDSRVAWLEVQRLRDRERAICDALGGVCDGGKYLNDILAKIGRLRRIESDLKTLHCLDVTAREGQRAFNEWRDRSVRRGR